MPVASNETRRASREVSVAGLCVQAGTDALERARSYDEAAWALANSMCAVTMWALALDAVVNSLLFRLCTTLQAGGEPESVVEHLYWWPLHDRVDLFFSLTGAPRPDYGRRPFQVVSTLKQVRDSIAHGKPFVSEAMIPLDCDPHDAPRSLQAHWESECSIKCAERHYEDMVLVYREMLTAAGVNLGSPMDEIFVSSKDLAGSARPLV